jgi:lysozyme
MNAESLEILRDQLLVDEGLRLKPYKDTVGKLTIGVGRNLSDKGISATESLYLLNNDIDEHWDALVKRFPWVLGLDEVRQICLLNLAFNMGVEGLAQFKNTLAAVQRGDWAAAARGLMNSKWHTQVQPSRSKRLIRMMLTGAV